jgi:hypothetical protein
MSEKEQFDYLMKDLTEGVNLEKFEIWKAQVISTMKARLSPGERLEEYLDLEKPITQAKLVNYYRGGSGPERLVDTLLM